MNRELLESFGGELRADRIFHLGTMAGNSLNEGLLEELSENPERWETLGLADPIAEFENEEGRDTEAWEATDLIVEHLYRHRKTGWLVCFAVPVPTRSAAKSWGYSWGYYHTFWFYSEESFEDCCQRAVPYARAYIREQRDKLEAAA